MEQVLLGMNPLVLVALALWTIPWKAWALWLAARRGDLKWFLALVIINTLGILDIVYIFAVAKQKDRTETE
jgi:methionyl-tRNA synthetase